MTEEQNKINNFNEDFISKEFIVKNYLGFDVNPGYEIITFIKSLDGKVEIENKGGKRVKATSFLKILSLGIHYNDKITIYCYGENQEKNLKEIEEFFNGIEVYPIEEIKENENNKENKINNVVKNTAKEKIMTEEQKKKCEEIINSYEEKYNKDFEEALSNKDFKEALSNISNIPEIPDIPESEIKSVKNCISIILFWYDKSNSEWEITSPLHLAPIPQDEAKAKFFELFAKTKDKTVENIIDLTVDLSEVFGKGMTREEAEKLLFTKKSVEIDGTLSYLNIFTGATEKFREIMKLYEKGILEYENYLKYIEEEKCSIKNIGEVIANYFDGKENNNKNNEEENKNFNKENKINNVVENTAKEKIMTEEQKKKCEEIINSYKTKLGDIDIGLLMNPFSIIPLIHHQHRYDVKSIISMTISLAKVFNKDISEEEAKKIIFELKEDLKENRDDEKYKDFESMSWAIVDKLDDELTLNLLILGQTGTGKSSIVNALVGDDVEKTSIGKPETPKERKNEAGEIERGIYPHSHENRWQKSCYIR